LESTLAAPLKVENLVKTYKIKGKPPIEAVKGVSFELKPGEVFGLLGPNGAGKTSIISTIVTLEEPTSGQIWVNGLNVQNNTTEAKMHVGFVPQEIINHGYFNVEEILDFHSGYYGLSHNQEQINLLLHELRLHEHRHKKVKQLSGGMKRRLLIAKALVHKPQLLLLDEPTAGVDVELRQQLWEFVKKLKQQGVTILLTTHYLEEAESLCDRVGILDKGEIKMIGPTRELVRKLTGREVEITLRGLPAPKVFQLASDETVGELLAKEKLNVEAIQDICVREGTLEEAFRRVLNNSNGKVL